MNGGAGRAFPRGHILTPDSLERVPGPMPSCAKPGNVVSRIRLHLSSHDTLINVQYARDGIRAVTLCWDQVSACVGGMVAPERWSRSTDAIILAQVRGLLPARRPSLRPR